MADQPKRTPSDVAAEIARIPNWPRDERDRLALLHELQVHQEEIAVQYQQLLSVQASLEESRERYVTLYDFAPTGYVTLDGSGLMLELNLTAASMFGEARQALVGMPLLRLIEDGDRGRFLDFVRRCRSAETDQTLPAMEIALKGKTVDAASRAVELVCTPRFVTRTGGREYPTAIIDISERKHSEAERGRADREHAEVQRIRSGIEARDEFLATVSHELRTPLNPVLAALTDPNLLDAVPPQLAQAFGMMRRNIKLEVRLIDDLLDLTRIRTGRLTLSREPTDFHCAIADVVRMFEPQARLRGVAFQLRLRAARPWVMGDPTRLHQVMWNLVSNALKFTMPDGRITISTANPSPDRLVIAVMDTGQGITAARLAELFASGADDAPRPVTSTTGLGLGLAICRRLISEHGGTLGGESGGEGRGSTFTIVLATCEPVGETASQEHAASDPPAHHRRILLVEDDRDSADMLRTVLQLHGYDVTVAGSVAEAYERAGSPHDLLISDLRLPDGTGHDLMRGLRRTQHDLPAIVLSGYGRAEDERKSRDAGFLAHLVKPVDMPTLIATIERITDASRATPKRDPDPIH